MRVREGETVKDTIPKIRAAAERAAMKIIDRVQNASDADADGDFESWFINLPEYDEFETILARLDEAVRS